MLWQHDRIEEHEHLVGVDEHRCVCVHAFVRSLLCVDLHRRNHTQPSLLLSFLISELNPSWFFLARRGVIIDTPHSERRTAYFRPTKSVP